MPLEYWNAGTLRDVDFGKSLSRLRLEILACASKYLVRSFRRKIRDCLDFLMMEGPW
jgi:hypothetical protein